LFIIALSWPWHYDCSIVHKYSLMAKNTFLRYFITVILIQLSIVCYAQTDAGCDKICGNWISVEKNIIVNVYRVGNDFKAKIVWFDDGDDTSKPMNTRVDYKNPDKALRNRKLIGMNILEQLEYKPKSNSWEDGLIYDAQSGRKWNAAAYLAKDGTLKVQGYWHFKFIGRTMSFNRAGANEIAARL
jgi:uncharacterized protein (DUF2147 family)